MRNHLREQGFTLVELLIAIFLGMMVMAAGYTVFQSSNRATREQNMDNRMQDNARVAMDVLSRHFRAAGFLVNFNSLPVNQAVDGVTSKVIAVNSNGAPDAVTIVSGALAQLGTLQRSADRGGNTLFLSTDVDMTRVPVGSVIGVGLTYSGLVQATNVAGRVVTLNTTVPTGALNMYYPGVFLQDGVTPSAQEPAPVRVLSRTIYTVDSGGTANSCGTVVHPVLQIVRGNGIGAVGGCEPVAEDIEDLQIAYGVDLNNNRIIEANEWINQPAANQIDMIRLARITIVARTAQPDPVLRGVAALAQTVPNIEDRPARANLTDGYRRYILTRIVKTRNLEAVFTL